MLMYGTNSCTVWPMDVDLSASYELELNGWCTILLHYNELNVSSHGVVTKWMMGMLGP